MIILSVRIGMPIITIFAQRRISVILSEYAKGTFSVASIRGVGAMMSSILAVWVCVIICSMFSIRVVLSIRVVTRVLSKQRIVARTTMIRGVFVILVGWGVTDERVVVTVTLTFRGVKRVCIVGNMRVLEWLPGWGLPPIRPLPPVGSPGRRLPSRVPGSPVWVLP